MDALTKQIQLSDGTQAFRHLKQITIAGLRGYKWASPAQRRQERALSETIHRALLVRIHGPSVVRLREILSRRFLAGTTLAILADAIGESKDQVRRALRKLRAAGYIVHVPPTNTLPRGGWKRGPRGRLPLRPLPSR
jgi:hypothetical protein